MHEDPDRLARLERDVADLQGRLGLTGGCLLVLIGGVVGGFLGCFVPLQFTFVRVNDLETATFRLPGDGPVVYEAYGPPGIRHDVWASVVVRKALAGFVGGALLTGATMLVARRGSGRDSRSCPVATPAPVGPARPVVRPPKGPWPDAVELDVTEVRTIAGGWVVVECDARGQEVPWLRGGVPVELRTPQGVVVSRVVAGEERHVRTRRPGHLAFTLQGPGPAADVAGVTTARVVFRL